MMLALDAVVVGAGPAGASAALVMARAGLQVAILERGETPGAKNVSGGILRGHALRQLLPEVWREAPLERRISRHTVTLLGETGAASLDFQGFRGGEPTAAAFSVLRPRLDRWLAQQAVDAGALLIPETVVDDLLWEGRQVVGVRARRAEGEVRSRIVIAADGVNSLLARRAGLRGDWRLAQVGLGVKETLRLPADVIDERFGVGRGEGASMLFVGGLPAGVRGGGFLYTNRDSLSVGVVLQLESCVTRGVSTVDALEAFTGHPAVRRLLRGGTLLEYSAHLVPESGANGIPSLCTDGLLVAGDAAGLALNTGLTMEGMHYAIASGVAAGETAVTAIQRGDLSRRSLSAYRDRLEAGGVLRDFRRFRHVPDLLRNPRLHAVYPNLVADMAERWFTVDERPRSKLLRAAREAMRGRAGLRQVLADGMRAGRALLWP